MGTYSYKLYNYDLIRTKILSHIIVCSRLVNTSFNLITSFWKRLGLYLKLMNVKWDNINRNLIWSKSDNDALQHRQCVLYIYVYVAIHCCNLENSKQQSELKIESLLLTVMKPIQTKKIKDFRIMWYSTRTDDGNLFLFLFPKGNTYYVSFSYFLT